MKKLLVTLMCIIMVVSLIPTMTFANEQPIAKIGETEYVSLEAAVKAAVDGDTIELMEDVVLDKTITVDIECGISILDDNKEKSIGLFGRIVSNLKMLYLLPMLSLVFNSMFYSVADAKIGIVLLIVFCFVMFVIIDIKTKIYNWLCDDLKKIKDINKDNRLKIMNFINMIISLDKLILVGETIMIIRFVMIILGFN